MKTMIIIPMLIVIAISAIFGVTKTIINFSLLRGEWIPYVRVCNNIENEKRRLVKKDGYIYDTKNAYVKKKIKSNVYKCYYLDIRKNKYRYIDVNKRSTQFRFERGLLSFTNSFGYEVIYLITLIGVLFIVLLVYIFNTLFLNAINNGCKKAIKKWEDENE